MIEGSKVRPSKTARSSAWVSNKTLILGVTALSCAVVVALLTRPSELAKPSQAPDMQRSAPRAAKTAPPEPFLDHQRDVQPAERSVPEVDWSQATPPSIDEVRGVRLPSVTPRKLIAKLGVDALVSEPKCTPRYAMVRDGREGPGGLGCAHVSKSGKLVPLGRWAHRTENGDLEVGNYEDGKRSGVWERYSKDGMLQDRGEYLNNERHAAWDEYLPTGEHAGRRNYHEGAFHGVTVLYHRGEPVIEVWNDGELVSTKDGFEHQDLRLAQGPEENEVTP